VANKVVNTILNLKDKMSPSILKATKNTKKMSKTMRKVQRAVNKEVWKMRKGFYYLKRDVKRAATNVAKVTATMATAIGIAGAKIGFSEAFNIEGFRVQLETAVGDTQKAAKKMAYATKFANSTPFETSSVMEATARLEAMGIKSEKWLPKIADMAGATNKSIQQSYEAVIDAVAGGELERLKEFGIRKDDLVKATDMKFGAGVVFDSRGSLKDASKLGEVLMQTMDDRFGGGAKKMSNTAKGLWSTITGVTKTSLANIVGITSEGSIKQGSAFDLLKKKMQGIVAKLNEWQESGVIQKISDGLVDGLKTASTYGKKFFDKISKIINFLKDNEKMVFTVVSAFLGFKAAAVAIAIATKAMALFKIVAMAVKGTLTPVMAFQVAITLLAAGFYYLYNSSETFRNKVDALIKKLKTFSEHFKKNLLPVILDFAKEIKNLAEKRIKKLIKFFKNLSKSDLKDKMKKTFEAFKALGAFLKKYLLPVFITIGKTVFDVLVFVFKNVIDVLKVLNNKALKPLGKFFKDVIIPIAKAVGLAFLGFIVILDPLIKFLISRFKPIFIGVFKMIKAYVITAIETIGGVISALTRIFSGIINFVVGVFTGDWEKAWNGVIEIFGGIFDGIKLLITTPIRLAINIANEFIDGFKEKFENLKTTITDVFEFLKEGGKGAFKSVGNFFVDIFNGIIEDLNGIEIAIPDWVPKIGGNSWGFDIPKFKKFATGTEYFSGGLAKINEFGGEIVNLPNGSQVIPSDKSEMMIKEKNSGREIKIIIKGDVYGDEAQVDRLFSKAITKLELALGNM